MYTLLILRGYYGFSSSHILCVRTEVPGGGVGPAVQIRGRLLSHNPPAPHHVGRLLLVRVGVLDHAVLPDEPLAAHVAREGLLAGVQAHVAAQVSLVVELFGAHLTLVGLVAGMLRQVLLQIKMANGYRQMWQ